MRATDFGLDRATQNKLYANGQSAARGFLKAWSFSRYVKKFRAP